MSFFIRPVAITSAVLLAASAATVEAGRAHVVGLTHEQRQARVHAAEGDRHMRAEAFARAIGEYESAERLDPLLVRAPYGIGRALMALRRYDAAVEAYQRAQRAFRSLQAAGVETRKAMAAVRDDEILRLKDSIRDAETTARLVSPSSRAGREIANDMRQMDAELDALENLRDSDVRGDGPARMPPALFLALGSAYFRAGRLVDAEREYKLALAARADLAEARNNLAVVYFETGRAAEAADEIREAEKAGFKVHPELKRAVSNALN
jgi:tetratricopeptide (TPR) repeat protein